MQGKRLALPTKKELPFGSGCLFIGVRFGQAFGLTYMRSLTQAANARKYFRTVMRGLRSLSMVRILMKE